MILINLKARLSTNLYNTLEPLGWILTFSFAFLWLQNRIMILGVLTVAVYGNLKFWAVPLYNSYGPQLPPELMNMLAPSVYLFSLGCLIMAQWPQFYPKNLVSPVRFGIWKLIGILAVVSLSMQYWGRT